MIFRTEKSDINFLNIFIQPILSSSIINKLTEEEITGKFPLEAMLYSWPYMVESIGEDETLWIKKLTLKKNPQYSENDFVIEKLIFKIFRDTAHFLKHKDSVSLFNDKESLIGDTLPRLEVFEYTLPQYVSLFLNTEKIPDTSLRRFILQSIERQNIIKIIWEKNFKEVDNPYITTESIENPLKEKNTDALLKRNGYYKKEELAKILINSLGTTNPQPSNSGVVNTQTTTKSTVIFSPSDTLYHFMSADDVLLKGKVDDKEVEAVYINDYKLKWFKKGDREFIYRLKQEAYDTIKEGENIYTISFEKLGERKKVEQLHYFFYRDEKRLESQKQAIISPVKQEETSVTNQLSQSKEISDKIDALDGKYLYNKDFERFSFTLLYPNTDRYMADTAKSIEAQLEQMGISIKLEAINVSDLNKKLLSWNKDYDMILVWINLGYFDSNIFPYFHSSQIKAGYNFSNYKKLSLDILLEDIKSANLAPDKTQELEKKVLVTLKEEAIVKTLYTPIIKQLVDKNIRNFTLSSTLNDDMLRIEWIRNAYISQKRVVQYSTKSFPWFFSFLVNRLFW